MANQVRAEITKELWECEIFSLMVDEGKDVSRTQQLSVVVRYVYNSAVYESFLDFTPAAKLDSESLTAFILSTLRENGIDIKKCVGQCYDGAAVMSGNLNGVQSRIKAVAPQANYVHCHAHRLNLCLVDVTKEVDAAAKFFSLVEQIYVFISSAAVHSRWLQLQEELFPGETPLALERLSDTRWTCRHKTCSTLLKRLPALIRLLENCQQDKDANRSTMAHGLLAQLDGNFVFVLVLMTEVLSSTRLASDCLQGVDCDLASAVELVHTLYDTLSEMRSEDKFQTLWNRALKVTAECSLAQQSSRTAKRRKTAIPSRLTDGIVDTTLGLRNEDTSSHPQHNARVNVMLPVLDRITSELERRFSEHNCSLMKGIQALTPRNSKKFLNEPDVMEFAKIYSLNQDDLVHEIHQLRRLIERKQPERGEMKGLMDVYIFLAPYKDAFSEMYNLYKIAAVLPVSSAACERSFSAMRCIKTYLRSTMANQRLSNLAVLYIESSRAKALNLDTVVDIFATKSRRIQLH
jgi:hypothetical protein